ncbi:cytochrome P450 [Mycena albidolilacea]|uniref:Cytochrome P450 n=1 Tax=Mycena albidolilacea TaxID=1033008 RepID=A0AAD7ETJ9_9AGAR|nr:cytochrome P450 [Mycena albidolilacea]
MSLPLLPLLFIRNLDLPPGLVFLASLLPPLLTPPLSTLLLLVLLREFSISTPTWATIILCVLSVPAAITCRVQCCSYINRRAAVANGAILAPEIPASFAGISTIVRSVKDLATGYPAELLGMRCEQLGNTYGIRIAFKDRVFTCEPQHIKAILATQFAAFEKGPTFRDIFNPLLGTGVFAADGSMWKFHRDMTRPFFDKHRISDFDNFDTHVEDAITQMKARLGEGHPFDFQELMGRVTLDCASAFLFGVDFHSLAEPLSYPYYVSKPAESRTDSAPTSFAPAFLQAQDITAVRMRYLSVWPLAEFWKDQIKAPMRVVERLLDPVLDAVVAKRRDAKNSGEETMAEPETLLEHLVEYTDDIKTLRDELLNISVAGRDTVTCLTTFAIYMLAEHPSILAKVRQEIFHRLGEKGRPNVDDIKEMKYLRAVLNETLRLYPPVPLNIRTSIQGVVLPATEPGQKPIYIPPNTIVPYSALAMHRRKDLWGPDALKFDPERFIDERLYKYLVPNPFIFLPFNGGPRICLGQQFAYQEASFILIRVLQAFSKISLAPNAQPPESRVPAEWKTEDGDASGWKRNEKIRPKSSLTMFVMGGLWVTMEE